MSFIKSISQTPTTTSVSGNDTFLGNQAGVTSMFNVSTVTNYLCGQYIQNNSFTYAKINEINTAGVSTYALLTSDINSFLVVNNASNNTLVTITSGFHDKARIGTQVILVQTGTGTVTVSSVYGEVNVISSFDRYKLVGQNSVAALVKITSSNWLLGGDTSI